MRARYVSRLSLTKRAGFVQATENIEMMHAIPSHEMVHQVLHLNPSRRPDPLGIPSNEGLQEFQANMFAASWVFWAANNQEKDDVLQQNPESLILVVSIFLSLGVIVTALGFHLWSRLSKGLSHSIPKP